MGEEVLVNEQLDAGEELIREFNEQIPVSVALWVVPADTDNPVLYIASDEISDENIDVAYRTVNRMFTGGRLPWLDPFQIKLLNTTDPIAQDALEIRERFPSRLPVRTRLGRPLLGGLAVSDVRIYPPLSTMKAS